MSRSSTGTIVASLILIALGVLFLFQNIFGGIPFLTLILKFFPVLFIWLGLARMYRVFFPHRDDEGKPVRPPSMTSAVFWLTLGVMLLLRTLEVVPSFLGLFGTWWPLILVLTGLGKIVEGLLPGRSSRLRGGEVVFLIFLILTGLTANYTSRLEFPKVLSPDVFGIKIRTKNSYSFTREAAVNFDQVKTVEFTHENGKIRLTPADGSNGRMSLDEEIYADKEDEAKVMNNSLSISQNRQADGVLSLAIDYGQADPNSMEIAVTLTIPAGVTVNIKNNNGEIIADNLTNPTSLETSNGAVTVSTHRGPLTVTNSFDRVNLKNVTGDMTIHGNQSDIILRDSSGVLQLDNRSGSLTMRRLTGASTLDLRYVELTGSDLSGNLRVTAPHSSLRFKTVKGNVFLESSYNRITLEDLEGNLVLKVTSAPVDLEKIKGRVSGSAQRGRITLDNIQQGVDLSLENCACKLQDIFGPVKVTDTIRTISLSNITAPITVKNRDGSIDFKDLPPDPSMRVVADTLRGDIIFRVPEFPSDRKVLLTFDGGFFDTDFSHSDLKKETEGTLNTIRNFSGPSTTATLVGQVKYGKIIFKKVSRRSR